MSGHSKAATDRTSLGERLRDRIGREGPIPFRDWMEAALYDPHGGYYSRPHPERWGRRGDYRTSPEYSPLFAATFARYFNKLHAELGAPGKLTILEAGAGAGHFAEGLLGTLQDRFPELFLATNYIIDEIGLNSGASARTRLERFGERVRFKPLLEAEIADTAIVFSNELLDSFPVHRVTTSAGQLVEFYVALDESRNFAWTTGRPSTHRVAEYLKRAGVELPEGQAAEINLAIADWLSRAAAKLNDGYIVTVDYGAEARDLYDSSLRNEGTLRAFRRHQFAADVLAHPGEQDITTTVDWTFAKQVGETLGLATIEYARLDRFLLRAGLLEEVELMTAEARDDAARAQLRTGSREMIFPDGLAASFQVLVQRKRRK